MSAWKELAATLKPLAPGLATALGGPLAGMAVGALTKATGAPEGSPAPVIAKAVQDALTGQGGNAEAIVQAEHAFQARMAELGVDLEKVHAADRDSARAMRVKLGADWTSSILAYLAVAMFGGLVALIGYMAIHGIEVGQDTKELVIFVLGHASGFVSSVYLFFYGSSKGKEEKP